MKKLIVRAPGQPPRTFEYEGPRLAIGRSAKNDLVIEDPSLSRSHARLEAQEDSYLLEDLGSLNGSFVNGQAIQGRHPVKPSDRIQLGNVVLELDPERPSGVLIETREQSLKGPATLVIRASDLRSSGPLAQVERVGGTAWGDAIQLVEEITLDLLHEGPVEQHLEGVMDRLFTFLKPDRGALLLRDQAGELKPVVTRSAGKESQIRISQTLVEAVVERCEALLVNDPTLDPVLSAAASIRLSGVSTLMAAPLEHGGEVIGLIYLDAKPYRGAFTREELRLVASMAHVAAAKVLQARLIEEVQAKRLMERELALAREIQQRLLPESAPALKGFELRGMNQASRQVSGDLFGYWTRPDGKVYAIIADVSGKGIGAGLLMASLQATMEVLAARLLPTGALAGELSQILHRHTTTNRFVTCFLVLLDPEQGSIQFTNAGHNPGLLFRSDGSIEALESHGTPLALLSGTTYGQDERNLGAGDLLVLYTDGITEACDAMGNELDLAGLRAIISPIRTRPLHHLEQQVEEGLEAFTGSQPPSDDRTLLLIRKKR
ncbi:MAG: SpoIIE family protein phosphatase [Acidobacteria bacterium]|nr:SpoIIE family protein phosphatase [Acidobacteriota bacterium]